MKIQKSFINMFRLSLFNVVLLFLAVSAYAQVDQGELQNLPGVTFISYEGPITVFNTREEIRQIGAGLGLVVANNGVQAGSTGRYFVIHSVSGEESGKLNADIFGLGVDTGVDHIRNLRTIIQGYLQTAYNYNERDAALLAEYITIYNAVYRGNWDYSVSRYKSQVISYLTRERMGLSIRYDEWPGRTLMLIPLGYGGLSSVDTSVISDSRVIEEMRREDDRGVEQRRDMVDLKEREAEEAAQRAQNERDTAGQEQERIDQQRAQNTQDRQQTAQDRQQLAQDQAAGRVSDQDARQRQEELDRRDQAAEERDRQLDEREEANEERLAEAQRLEDFSEQKAEEARQDRREIAQDQTSTIAEENAGGVIGIILNAGRPSFGRLVRLSTAGREIRRSSLDTVHVRTVTLIGGKIIAIAGESGRGVRLVEIDQNSLEMAKQGDDELLTGSLLWVNGNDIYAITNDMSSSSYLARFNTNLQLLNKSAVKVNPNASVNIQQGRLLSQREDGSALMLNPVDLTEIR
jgi:multidrug efflux pump subunit AcrA (membrane-fusion protein)